MTQLVGVVEFFDSRKGFGKIKPSAGGDLVFVHATHVVDQPDFPLTAGEDVSYATVVAATGIQARDVTRTSKRYSGTVEYFDRQRGAGTIAPDDGGTPVTITYANIVSTKEFRSLEEGQQVDYSVQDDSGRLSARLVLPDTRTPLERFAALPSLDRKLDALARLAEHEDWGYKYKTTAHQHPILFNYLQHTFRQIQEEGGKIAEAQDPEGRAVACFNTGLVTEYYDPIFAGFAANRDQNAETPWILMGFFTESQFPITSFQRRPEMANYFSDPTDLIYDRRLTLVRNVQHIVEDRVERFPGHLQSDKRRLAGLVDIAIARAEQRVLRNYKTAIPQYNHGRIQLLLPLCLEDPKVANGALVVGKEGAVYKGYTVLTLDMAYNNARLLTRPDREWLLP